jgi:hypothetical protein
LLLIVPTHENYPRIEIYFMLTSAAPFDGREKNPLMLSLFWLTRISTMLFGGRSLWQSNDACIIALASKSTPGSAAPNLVNLDV